MIRVFAELDRKMRQRFGKRHLKEALASCRAQVLLSSFIYPYLFSFFVFVNSTYVLYAFYIQGVLSNDSMGRKIIKSPAFVPAPHDFRENVHTRFVMSLRADVCFPFLHSSI
jgi:hypothetical protein